MKSLTRKEFEAGYEFHFGTPGAATDTQESQPRFQLKTDLHGIKGLNVITMNGAKYCRVHAITGEGFHYGVSVFGKRGSGYVSFSNCIKASPVKKQIA